MSSMNVRVEFECSVLELPQRWSQQGSSLKEGRREGVCERDIELEGGGNLMLTSWYIVHFYKKLWTHYSG